MRIGDHLSQHRHHSSKKVEGHVPQRIHGVFDFRPKGPQEDHVADDVRPTSMLNMAVRIVIQRWPPTMLAGTAAQLSTNASPPSNSCTKTNPLITIMGRVISGKCAGRRDASDNGMMVPTLFSRSSKRFDANELLRTSYRYCLDQATLVTTRRAATHSIKRVILLQSLLIPTSVPIIHSVLEGHVLQIITARISVTMPSSRIPRPGGLPVVHAFVTPASMCKSNTPTRCPRESKCYILRCSRKIMSVALLSSGALLKEPYSSTTSSPVNRKSARRCE